jgi:DNA-binding PadR family transcriptional regulator
MGDVSRELLILGVLRRGPFSAYALDRAVHGHAALYRPLKRGNVYATLERFTALRYVTRRAAKAARGPNPTKSVYRLSSAGEERFQALLEATLLDTQADDAALEMAYVLLGQLPRPRALALMTRRRDAVTQLERRLARLLADTAAGGGAGYLGASHAFSRSRAEQRFLGEAIALLENPKWAPAWQENDGPVSAGRKL